LLWLLWCFFSKKIKAKIRKKGKEEAKASKVEPKEIPAFRMKAFKSIFRKGLVLNALNQVIQGNSRQPCTALNDLI